MDLGDNDARRVPCRSLVVSACHSQWSNSWWDNLHIGPLLHRIGKSSNPIRGVGEFLLFPGCAPCEAVEIVGRRCVIDRGFQTAVN